MKPLLLGTALVFLAASTRDMGAKPKDNIYHRHNLVSDLPGQGDILDPNLANPWGIAYGPGGPFWISDNHTGVSTVYDSAGHPFPAASPLIVTIPPASGGMPPAAPTGIVFNGSTTSFDLGTGMPPRPAKFIFSSENGTITGWNPQVNPTQAILKVDNSTSGAIYKGLAIGNNGTGDFIYATNFFAGTVDVFDASFMPALPGAFVDSNLPAGFAPFGIQNIAGHLIVTYAKQDADKEDDSPGPGNGFVDVYTTSGVLEKRLITGGVLNSPWGIALAPGNFGDLSNTLLIGNFGDGTIHGFNPQTGELVGQILIPSGRPMIIPGLWGLIFGNGGSGGDPGILYFTAGIPGNGEIEDHGQFGEIRPQHP